MSCLSCWWCSNFLGLFFVGAVNFRAVIFFGWLVFCWMLFFWLWWFLVVFWFGLFFGCCKVWGWFQLLGVWFLLVSVLLDAVGCCFYIGALVGLVVWFLWRFCNFAEFCQFVPLPILEFLNFGAELFIVQLETSTRLIFIFLKALEWIRLFNYCNFIFWICNTFFDFSLAFTIDFFIN